MGKVISDTSLLETDHFSVQPPDRSQRQSAGRGPVETTVMTVCRKV